MPKLIEVFVIFLRLGFTSFGGPIAHLSYFHDEFVKKRRWMNEHGYADLVALCQFLPGPASSQVGMAIGLSRAGIPGAIAAWIGFTMPSAILLVLFAMGLSSFENGISASALHGLKVVAVAVVAQALWGMGKNLCPDKQRATIAVLASIVTMQTSSAFFQVGVIAAGGIVGCLYLRKSNELPHTPIKYNVSKATGAVFLTVFLLMLGGLPLVSQLVNSDLLKLFDGFFRAGSLVFGGGHVVLPLLQAEVVPTGWVTNDAFMAGYGAAQAIPGPLFSFSAFLGAIATVSPSIWIGAGMCLVAAFLPSFLLIIGALPFWEKFREHKEMRFAMQGINAAVVGVLLSAFYHPVWTSSIHNAKDFGLAAFGFLLLVFWKAPSWLVVVVSAVIAGLLL